MTSYGATRKYKGAPGETVFISSSFGPVLSDCIYTNSVTLTYYLPKKNAFRRLCIQTGLAWTKSVPLEDQVGLPGGNEGDPVPLKSGWPRFPLVPWPHSLKGTTFSLKDGFQTP
ncbi:hypothetical protein DPX16_20686 [Anabarilius grahami]|uniref:Uncharacterized protein n=1 Tax=Anabarilius grahami TaxID=495550 RepID=A0A3N0Y194_ANAGA|nr:hypothetical protein DPX16_23403 [Anabarilius grahami]ROL47034.1 hypothetical protein DPX16_20686 [Anabarilius grahami]